MRIVWKFVGYIIIIDICSWVKFYVRIFMDNIMYEFKLCMWRFMILIGIFVNMNKMYYKYFVKIRENIMYI